MTFPLRLRLAVIACALLPGSAMALMINLAVPYNWKTSHPRSADMIFYAPDQPDYLFTKGPEVTIWCQPVNRALSLKWTLCRNRVNTPFAHGAALPRYDNSFLITIPAAGLIPAFYDLHVQVDFGAKQTAEAITTFGWKPLKEAGVPVVPADFKSFWLAEKRKVDATPLDLKVNYVRTVRGADIDHYNVTQGALPENFDPGTTRYSEVEVYKVDFAAPGAPGLRIYGWYTKPPGPGPFPALLVLPGAGNNPRPEQLDDARHGYAVLDIQVHNEPVDLPPDQYPKLKDDRVYSTIQHYPHYQVYLNMLQGANALAALPCVDPDRMAVIGASQGGRGTILVAALDHRFKAAVAAVTHFADLPWLHWTERLNRAHDAGNRSFTRKEMVFDDEMRVESYYDVSNFAPMIECPILMNSGLIDSTAPPVGIFQVFRNINAPKKMIPSPNFGHDWEPAFDRHVWRWLDKKFGLPAPPPSPGQ